MAQQFQALRCYLCKTFQVQQVKKSKKWNCKLCGEKQSVLKVHGQGSGADCRQHVQKLNMLQGERMQAMEIAACSIEEPTFSNDGGHSRRLGTESEQVESPASSRWSVYLEQKPVEEAAEGQGGEGEIVYTDRQQFQADGRNASRGRSKRKRGLHPESEPLDPYRYCTDNDERESARNKKRSYLKYVNTTPNEISYGNPEIGETQRSDVLNQSKLESNPRAGLGMESQNGRAAFPAKPPGAQPSRWERFLPRGNKFLDQDAISCGPKGYPTWKRDPTSTEQPWAHSVLEDHEDYVDGKVDIKRTDLAAGLVLAGDGWPCLPCTTGGATEGDVTVPLGTNSLELVEEATVLVGLPELASDSHGPSSKAGGAMTDIPACDADRVSHIPKSWPLSPPLAPPPSRCPAQPLPAAAPGYFLSLFQTDEDFDDL
ncbi:MRN complex-interacting protein [Heptranchias perlo]|uniref:MRN complex-interacting protein n=1 Tax=Heptranchias perlo TaxID=212740 RepID=UPI00355940ED